ncbi:sensor histidine kinase [Winogradskyella tangerina]|uniref:sensor histidine kinase n=1 Tax=Winogradskyella tangerina TaxID=2023240 RepID=UPI000DBE2870|nr:histidine kinase [Winogradskyella tangerina]
MKNIVVKQSTLISIALLIAFLVNLPRILELYEVFDSISKSFNQVSINDVLTRVIFLSVYAWIGLQLNTNWIHTLFRSNKILNALVTTMTNIVLFFATVFLFFFIHRVSTNSALDTTNRGMVYFVYFTILVIVIFISRILRFQIIHRNDLAEKELLKQQSLQNEITALKNQINPHFLFNALNSLNSLVRGNDEATTFVNELAYMYRYILQSGQQDLTTVKEELKFLNSYIYLIKARYRDRFSIEINIPEDSMRKSLPTLSLQLLVENAIKHNEISEAHPLNVSIYMKDEMLVVENKIRPRATLVHSTGKGLENINKRYKLLMGEHITISDHNNIFIVKLPLIQNI